MKKIISYLLIGISVLLIIYGLNIYNTSSDVVVGAEQTDLYLPLLKNNKVAVVSNHTSLINNTHLVDSLLDLGIIIEKIFSPEHGFRGDVDAGEYFGDHIDSITGLPVISLYGDNFKPKSSQLSGIDIVIFDIQDVGVRFYTYISTLHYIMEACAENNIKLIVLDRPNPNGFYIDGPVLDMDYASFVGLHPIPVVYGMTIGELALMVNSEKWLKNDIQCHLIIIPCLNYSHSTRYSLPVNPSPNIQSMEAVYLYPSLGLFEGTIVSVGRGTDSPFRVIGYPDHPYKEYSFTPHSIPGICKYPMYRDSICYGINLQELSLFELKNCKKVDLQWLKLLYDSSDKKDIFFNNYFRMLAGSKTLENQIISGISVDSIEASWKYKLDEYKQIREKYLLYPDFE